MKKNQRASKVAFAIAWIAIVILAGIVGYQIYQIKTTAQTSSEVGNIENSIGENITGEILNNQVEENIVVNEIQEEQNQINGNTQVEEEASSSSDYSSKEEHAVQLAMDKYGEAEDVYFSIDEVTTDGKYIVSVRETETTFAIITYEIDIETETVTLQ